ncbi:Carbonic anhydrase 1 [Phycisphaerae bacterium RAS2]|nr:Carbonic anhydrase 1 [Phycisphaerae bacterium RAS2]
MEKIIQGVRHFHDKVFPAKKALFRKLAKQQRPRALFIACSDSRVHPNLITQTDPGELFIMRNPGNMVPAYHAGDDSESATIEFAVAKLDVIDIIVCGHSDCGAMNALMQPSPPSALPAVASWLRHAEGTRRVVSTNYGRLPLKKQVQLAIERNVLIQLNNLRTHPSVAAKLAAGNLRLHAWTYDIATGDVASYDCVSNQFHSLTQRGRAGKAAKRSRRGR